MKQKLTDSELISLYFQDKLDPKERHQLERRALDDPFLSDAMEGFDLRNVDALEAEKMLNEEIRRKEFFTNSSNTFHIIPRKQPEESLAKRAASLAAPPKSNPAPAFQVDSVPGNSNPTPGNAKSAHFRQLGLAASIVLLAISGWYILYLNKTKYNETRSGSAQVSHANQNNQAKIAKRNVENALPQSSVSQPLAQGPPNPTIAEKRTHLPLVISKKIPNPKFSQTSSPSKISAINKDHFLDSNAFLAASQKQLPTKTASPSASQKLLPIPSALPSASPRQFSDSNQFIASNPRIAKRSTEINKSSEVNRSVHSHLESFASKKAVRENKEDVNNKPIDSSSIASLNEVVVIGYGTYKNWSSPIIGWEKFNEMLRKNDASPDGHVGIVTVRFYVDQDGKPYGITVIKKLSKSCDRKAKKIISNGPTWILSKTEPDKPVKLDIQFIK